MKQINVARIKHGFVKLVVILFTLYSKQFLAKKRLRYLKKHLDKNPVLNTYDEIIKDHLNQGIVEKVPQRSRNGALTTTSSCN